MKLGRSFLLALALAIVPAFSTRAQTRPPSYVETLLLLQNYVASQGDFVTEHDSEEFRAITGGNGDRSSSYQSPLLSNTEQRLSASAVAFQKFLNVSLASESFVEGEGGTPPPFPENSRITDGNARSQLRDRLTIKSTTAMDSIVIKFKYHVTGTLKNTAKGGAALRFGMALGDYQAPGNLHELAFQQTDLAVDEMVTCSVPGKISPAGFVPSGTLITPPTVNLDISLAAGATVTTYTTEFSKCSGMASLVSIAFETGDGSPIKPSQISITSAGGLKYADFLPIAPLEAGPAQFHGPIEATVGLLRGGFDALVNLGRGYSTAQSLSDHSQDAAPAAPFYTFSATLTLGAGGFKVGGSIASDGTVTFTPGNVATKLLKLPGGKQLELTLSLQDAATNPRLVGQVRDPQTGDIASITGGYLSYRALGKSRPAYPIVPDALAGVYTLALPPAPAGSQSIADTLYPAGAGVATLTVGSGGTVKVKGTLADGSPLSCSGALTNGNECYLFSRLYGGKGSLSGKLIFRNTAGQSDVDAADFLWTRPAAAGKPFYPAGWPDAVKLTAIGSHYTPPATKPPACVFTNLPTVGAGGNAHVTLTGGGLGSPLSHRLDIAPTNSIKVTDPAADLLSLSFIRGTGIIRGSFRFPGTGKATKVNSVVLEEGNQALGYFLTPSSAGSVGIQP